MRFHSIRNLFPLIVIVSASASAEISFSVPPLDTFRNASPGSVSFLGSEFTGTSSGGSLPPGNLGTFALVRPDQEAGALHGDSSALEVLLALPVGITGSASILAPPQGTVNTQLGKVLDDSVPPGTLAFGNSSGSGPSVGLGSSDSGLGSSGLGLGSSALGLAPSGLTLSDVPLVVPGSLSDVDLISEILTGKANNMSDLANTSISITNPEPLSIVLLGTVILLVMFGVRSRARTVIRANEHPF